MFNYLLVAFHWYINAWPQFTHHVFYHKGNNWPDYWIMVAIVAAGSLFIVGCIIDENDGDSLSFVRIWTMFVAGALLWPWILLCTLPVALALVVGTIVVAWCDKIPSKEQRIAKRKAEVEEITGKIVDIVRSHNA